MEKNLVLKILTENKDNYNLIAGDFDKKRGFLWPEIEATASYIAPESLVLDVGCGNGRIFPLVTQNGGKYLGFDISENLIKIAQTKYGEKYFFVADLLRINNSSHSGLSSIPTGFWSRPRLRRSPPQNDNFKFDLVYCLAILHHIPSSELRLQALQNIKSLLKPNAILILSVWNLWQKKYLKYVLREFFFKLIGKSKLDWGDCYVPYKIQKSKFKSQNFNSKFKIKNYDIENSLKIKNLKFKIIPRYLHVFTLKDLVNLIKTAGFQILEKKKTKGNLLIIAKLKIDL